MLPSLTVPIVSSLGAALLAGIVGSPHCMGMCGGFAVACGGGRQGLPWHAGRLTTYAMLGALAAAFGAVLPGPAWFAPVVSGALLLWFAAALAGLVPEPTLKLPGVTRLATRAMTAASDGGFVPRFTLGLATGLLPCGLVYAALAVPVAAGDPVTGALSMAAFGLGTVPALAFVATGARRLTLRHLSLRRVAAALVLTMGLLSVGMRQGWLGASHHGAHPAAAPHADPTHSSLDTPLTAETPHGF